MSASIDDLTVEYTEDGVVTIKELDKLILTKGAWCTVIYKIQNWDRAKQVYSPVSYTIRRYQKRNGEYQQRSRFNISSKDQAQKIVEALSQWMREE